jgi:hypothetical protein
MKKQEYLDLKKRHEQELNDFPIAYAFNDEQLKEALKKLGVKSTKECVTVLGHGDIVRKGDGKKLVDMMVRHTDEIKQRLKEDPDFATAAFRYEMDNHEYAINWDGDDDILRCFAIDWNDVEEWGLQLAWNKARREHFKMMEEYGVI